MQALLEIWGKVAVHEKRFTDTVKRLKGQQKTRLVKDIWRLKRHDEI